MKVVNALVTSVGGPIGQGILKGLKKMGNVRKVGTDRRNVTAGTFFCDAFYQTPSFSDSKKYVDSLNEIIQKEAIDVVFPSHPNETELYTLFQKELQVPFALPKSDYYDSLVDKEAVYHILEQENMKKYVPKYQGFTSNNELLTIKKEVFSNQSHLIVKNVKGYGALGFAVTTDRKHYLKDIKRGKRDVYSIDDYLAVTENERRLAMEILDQPEYSVDVYVSEGKTVVAVPRKRSGVSSGLVLDGTVENHLELRNIASEIAEVLVTDGFLNMQFMLSEDGYKLTDLNPRFCGSQVMSLGANVNFPELFIEYELFGNHIVPEPAWGTRMLRYRESIFVPEHTEDPGIIPSKTNIELI